MAFNVENFKSQTKLGFLKPSNFLTYILPAPWALSTQDDFDIAYLTTAASLPGVQILTQEAKIYGAGPMVKMPYDIATTDISMTFYADAEGKSIDYFYEWMRNIVNLSHDQGAVRSGAFSNQIAYRSWYSTSIDLMLFNDRPPGSNDNIRASPQDNALAIYTLFDAFPVSMTEPALSWQSGNEILQFNVVFTYRSFERTVVNPPAVRGINTPAIPIPGTVEFPQQRPVAEPPTLSKEKPQSVSKQGSRAAGNSRLQAINDFAKGIREGAANVRTESVSKVQDVRKAIMDSSIMQTSINVLNTANEVKRTLGTLKQLNNSLKSNLITSLKGQVKGGLSGFGI